jgi:hypothetical protein
LALIQPDPPHVHQRVLDPLPENAPVVLLSHVTHAEVVAVRGQLLPYAGMVILVILAHREQREHQRRAGYVLGPKARARLGQQGPNLFLLMNENGLDRLSPP